MMYAQGLRDADESEISVDTVVAFHVYSEILPLNVGTAYDSGELITI